MVRRTPTKKKTPSIRKLRLKPANPFDLIRLIAHSQSDPRKALAELVQNALDAEARHVTITRMRRRGEIVISILDDGNGVFSDLERPLALERIATNIGHSFKRNLSPAERQRQMLLGKYGIGLLGFWAVGQNFEIRTRVSGSEVWALHLRRDEPSAEVRKVPQSRLTLGQETWTEATIRGVHPGVSRQLTGRRLGEYLGSELRGQLLSREVKLRVLDRLARGSTVKDFLVVPQRFHGRRVEAPTHVAVTGFSNATLELYLTEERDERPAQVTLSCGGTVVCEDLGSIEGQGLDRELWSSGRLEGIVEFPDIEVAPTTRREFVPGPAADALFAALRSKEPALRELLKSERARRLVEEDEHLAKELRRIFRPLPRNLPQYDFFDIAGEHESTTDETRLDGEKLGGQDLNALAERATDGLPEGEEVADEKLISEDSESGDEPEPPPELLPPGALEGVRIVPRKSRLLPGASRRLLARAVDDAGRTVTDDVEYAWEILSGEGTVAAEANRVLYSASETIATVHLGVWVRQGERLAQAKAEVEVVEKLRGENPEAGIPDPKRAFDAEGDWRSRMRGRLWEYNAAHPDYRAVADESRARLRYLTHLFAKEIVLRNYGEPTDERLLERMVEVLTHIRRGK